MSSYALAVESEMHVSHTYCLHYINIKISIVVFCNAAHMADII